MKDEEIKGPIRTENHSEMTSMNFNSSSEKKKKAASPNNLQSPYQLPISTGSTNLHNSLLTPTKQDKIIKKILDNGNMNTKGGNGGKYFASSASR